MGDSRFSWTQLAGRHVAVTGGNGFVGRHLVRALARAGAEVHALRGPGGGEPETLPNVRWQAGNLSDPQVSTALVAGCDVVIHAAGPPSVVASLADPVTYAQAHVVGTSALLMACREAGVARLVFISSAEIYGRVSCDPVPESTPLLPVSPYGVVKLAAEQLVACFARATDLQAVALRPFSIYGRRPVAAGLIGVIERQLRGGDDLCLQTLRPVRDFIHVHDVADAAARAAVLPLTADFVALNIGSGEGCDIRTFAATCLRAAGRVGRVSERGGGSARPADIVRLVADVGAAEATLGWRPTTSLLDGLRQTLGSPPSPSSSSPSPSPPVSSAAAGPVRERSAL